MISRNQTLQCWCSHQNGHKHHSSSSFIHDPDFSGLVTSNVNDVDRAEKVGEADSIDIAGTSVIVKQLA